MSDTLTLRRIPRPVHPPFGTSPPPGSLAALYVDVETTGLDPKAHEIIEFAATPFRYDLRKGAILEAGPTFHQYNQPREPIPADITELTGITDAMVAGHRLDLSAMPAGRFFISHNAAFDRAFLEPVDSRFVSGAWACSATQIDWRKEGIRSRALEFVAFKLGWFYEAHSAVVDAEAGVHILGETLPKSGKLAMAALLENARADGLHVWATEAPFDNTPRLKERGYMWSPGDGVWPKAWHKSILAAEWDSEWEFLMARVYANNAGDKVHIVHVDARNRFSSRIAPPPKGATLV